MSRADLALARDLLLAGEAWGRVEAVVSRFHALGKAARHAEAETARVEAVAQFESCLDVFARAYRVLGDLNGEA